MTTPVHITTWESIPEKLRPPVYSTTDKIGQYVYNFFSVIIPIIGLVRLIGYGLATFAARNFLLPASQSEQKDKILCLLQFSQICEQNSAHFDISRHPIQTPDGALLSTHLFKHKNANETTPTIIYFQGNGSLKGMGGWEWILQDSFVQKKPVNLVLFDYRSVDESTGEFSSAKDLLVDGASVADWIRKKLHTPANKIHFYGMSLGGAIALKTKAASPDFTGKLVSERSFSSIERVVSGPSWAQRFAIWLLKTYEFELDAAADLPHVQGPKRIAFHRKDPVIRYPASLAAQCEGASDRVELTENHEDNHNAPLPDYQAKHTISNFIFST